MPALEIILKALPFINLAIPEVANLISSLRSTLNEDDQATLDAAVAASDKRADDQHDKAQGL